MRFLVFGFGAVLLLLFGRVFGVVFVYCRCAGFAVLGFSAGWRVLASSGLGAVCLLCFCDLCGVGIISVSVGVLNLVDLVGWGFWGVVLWCSVGWLLWGFLLVAGGVVLVVGGGFAAQCGFCLVIAAVGCSLV